MRQRVSILFFSSAIGVAACAGKTTDATPAPNVAEDFIARAAETACAVETCCSQVGYDYDHDACVASLKDQLNETYGPSRNKGGTYDPSAADRCLTSMRQLVATCANSADRYASEAACSGIFSGTKAPGETCTYV